MNINKKGIYSIILAILIIFQSCIMPVGEFFLISNVYAEEIDSEAPTVPQNINLQSKTDTTIELIWDACTDNVAVFEYDIYRDGVLSGTTNDVTFNDTGLSPNTTYVYSIKARDVAGNTSEASSSLEITTELSSDVTAPTAPSNLVLVAKSYNSIELSWGASVDDVGVAGYDILINGTPIVQGVNVTNYVITGLTPNTEYNLSIVAKDEAGNLSEASDALLVKTLLATPVNVISSICTTKIILSWDAVDDAASYDIEVDGVLNEGVTATSYTHNNLLSNTQHTYKIRAKNGSEESSWGQEISATTGVLSIPSNISTSQTFTSITVSWDSVDEADEYDIEMEGVIVANVSELFYTHYELLPNTPHSYKVRARNSGGVSEWSELISINTTSYGTGTEQDPYIITTKEKLNNIRNDLSAHYKLGNDIDLEGMEWEPIGTNSLAFTGSLDGNGYAISNLTINKLTSDYVGLFGYVNNSIIKNLEVKNVNITGKSYVGGIIGVSAGNSGMELCSVTGTGSINGISFVGGMVGSNWGTIEKCFAEISVASAGTSTTYTGGLVGITYKSISKSYSTGNVTSSGSYIGGLLGCTQSASVILNECYSTGDWLGITTLLAD